MLKKLNNNNFWNMIILILIYGPPILSLKVIPMPLETRYRLVTGMIKMLFGFGTFAIFIIVVVYLGALIFKRC